jgi:mRNA interferase RelE/StbE
VYQVVIVRSAQKEIAQLPSTVSARVVAAIQALAETPRPDGCVKLQGSDDLWRIRVGQYRIVYKIDDAMLIVTVVKVAHRSSVYR